MRTTLLIGLSSFVLCTAAMVTPDVNDSATFVTRTISLQGDPPPGNGKCCVVQGGASCEANPPASGDADCGYNPVYNCSCLIPGNPCGVTASGPFNHDICKKPQIMFPGMNCTLVQTYCYTRNTGACGDDAGAWSWLGFCTMCGCGGVGNQQTPFGTRQVCAAGSSGC